jgi:flagellar motor switch protein FliM
VGGVTSSTAPIGGSGRPSTKRRAGVRADGAGFRVHDVRARPSVSPESVALVRMGGERFAEIWAAELSATLRVATTVAVTDIQHLRLSDVVADVGAPVSVTEIATPPLALPFVLVLPRATALQCIDWMLGGGAASAQPERPISDIDAALLPHLLTAALAALPRCFPELRLAEGVHRATYQNSLEDPAELPIEDVLAIQFQLLFGEVEARAALCLPGISVAEQLQSAHGRPATAAANGKSFRDQVSAALTPVRLEVAAEFRPVALSPKQLLSLAVGDVLRLNHSVSTPLAITAAGTVVARGVPGADGNKLAVLVVDPSNQEQSAW